MNESPHRNRQLFSNHFLDHRLRVSPEWQEVAEQSDALRSVLQALFEKQAPALPRANERQTEERWLIPVLRALGWEFVVQPKSEHQGTLQFPDYAMFADPGAARAAAADSSPRELLARANAILEAKRWGRDLDGFGTRDDRGPNRVPSAQIINYLIRAGQPWGILTNGREWRLYNRDANFADTVYYAVNLPALLGDAMVSAGRDEAMPAREAFRYFLLFFRPAAFVPGLDGARWVDSARQASLRYARAVEEALKPRAYSAVTALCRGFVNWPAAHGLR